MKKISLSWKKIRNKFYIVSFVIVPVVGATVVSSYNALNTSNNLTSVSSDLNAIDSTNNSRGTYTMTATQDTVSWWGQKLPEEVKAEDIRSLIGVTANNGDQITANVNILPITKENIVGGYVNFFVAETAIAADGNVTTAYATPPTNVATTDTNFGDGITVPTNKIWSTKSFAGLIKGQPYNYAWVSDEEISSYLKNFSGQTLTADDVWLNMLDHTNNNMPPLSTDEGVGTTDPQTVITVTAVDPTYGIWKISVSSLNADSGFDTTGVKTLEKVVRGVAATNVDGSTMKLEQNVTNLSNLTISDATLFNGATDNAQVSTLTASQFVSPIGGETALIDLFTKGTGVGSNPLIDLAYAGNKYKVDGSGELISGSALTGDSAITANELSVTSINAIPNDSQGSLEVVIKYKTLDVYSNTYVEETKVLSWPANTFKINEFANSEFTFSWKAESQVQLLGTSYDIVNAFKKNADNSAFVQTFSNQFFIGTSDTYNTEREVNIDYSAGSTESNGNYVSGTEDKTIVVTLTFKGLPGFTYTDANGQQQVGFQTTATYTLKGYEYYANETTLKITWKTQTNLFNENPTFYEYTPSEITSRIMRGTVSNDVFYSSVGENGTIEVSYYPNNKEGTLTVYVTQIMPSTTNSSSRYLYTQTYQGFKKNNSDSEVVEYSWIPQSEIPSTLLNTSLTKITKQQVINDYLKNIPLFENSVLDDTNVTIIPVITDTSSYLNVQVYISDYSETTNTTGKAFYTNIYGFMDTVSQNNTNFNPPKDYTALISIIASSVICVSLASVLVAMISRRARIRNFKTIDVSKKKKPGSGSKDKTKIWK